MRKLYWYLSAYVRKHGLIFVFSLVGAIVLFSFFISSISQTLETKQTHYIGIIGSYTLSSLPDIIGHQISAGLTQVKEDGSVAPLLAQRWTIEQEGTAYRFVLKDDLVWQDGKEVKPEDVLYQLQDVEVIATPQDIVFKLPTAFSPFPTKVSQPIFREGELKTNFFFSQPTLIGIGPYQITHYIKNKGNKIKELTVESQNERYIYRFFLTEKDATVAFKRGQVDILPDLAKHHDIMDWENVQVLSQLNYNQYLAVFFNHQDPIFQKNIRQALSYATHKPIDDTRATGPLNPQSWAYLAGGKSYDYDLDRAVERLLDEVPRNPLSFNLTTTTLFEDEAKKIKDDWEKMGRVAEEKCKTSSAVEDKSLCPNLQIAVNLHITNFPDVGNFQLLLVGQETSPDPDQYEFWHSGEPGNITGYKNTRIDNLLEKGRQTYEKQARKEIYQEFQQFLLEDAPSIFIKFLPSYTVERD